MQQPMVATARRLLQAPPAGTPGGPIADRDIIIILASLLCALICVLSIGLVARCSCSRRVGLGASPAANRGVKKEVLRAGVRHLPRGVRGRRGHPRAAAVRALVPRRLHRQVAPRPLVLPFLPPDPGRQAAGRGVVPPLRRAARSGRRKLEATCRSLQRDAALPAVGEQVALLCRAAR